MYQMTEIFTAPAAVSSNKHMGIFLIWMQFINIAVLINNNQPMDFYCYRQQH